MNANKFIFCFLDIYRPVRADNLCRRHVVFPIIAFRYSVPLCFCSFKSNARKTGAFREGRIADARHSFADCHARKTGAFIEGTSADARHAAPDCYARKPLATLEGTRTDTCHAVGDCHTRKSLAIKEGTLADARHAAPDCHARKPGAIIEGIRRNCRYSIRDCNGCGMFIVYIQLLVACTIFHQIVQSANIAPCRYIHEIYVLNVVATLEGIFADARHAVGNYYARKSGATIEGFLSNACHAVRDCYARKPGAIKEGIFADARHATICGNNTVFATC